MLCAKNTRREFNARPCSQVYNRCAAEVTIAASAGKNRTTVYGARVGQTCQLAALGRPASCHPRCRPVVWTSVQKKKPKSVAIEYARKVRQVCASNERIERSAIRSRRNKKRRPFAIGHGLRGGRWPGPQVERDGENCYRGRRLGDHRPQIARRRRLKKAGIAVAGIVCLPSHTRPGRDWFMRIQQFSMAFFRGKTHGDGRRP